MPLTDTAIKAAKPGPKPFKIYDEAGLFLVVTPAGGKWWRFKYRIGTKEKLLSLGTYPEVSLKAARDKRDEMRHLLDAGMDPSAERQADNLRKQMAIENSFEAVAREWFGKRSGTWVPGHAQDVMRRMEMNLFPDLSRRPIAEIEAPELLRTLRKIEDRGAHDLSHRVLQVASQVFRYGISTGLCSRDVAADLRGALTSSKIKHQAAVKPEELPQLLVAIAGYESTGDKQTRIALQLLAHTFVRTGELIGAQWDEINEEQSLWIVPSDRMKMRTEHVVPLSRSVLGLLAELKPLSGHGRFLFPGRTPAKPISNNTLLFALYRLGYKNRMTGHGFRAVASTCLNESGFRPDVIERQLAHAERNEIRGAYNRAEYLEERRKMMEWWSGYLDALQSGAKVIPFNRVA